MQTQNRPTIWKRSQSRPCRVMRTRILNTGSFSPKSRGMFWLTGRSNFSFWAIPHQSPTYILMFWGQNQFFPPQIQLVSRRTGAVLTRRMATYNKVVLTKVASNHTSWWPNPWKWLSRLTCPPQIQFESKRTGAVLTRRMSTYKEVVLTKVASNHTSWWPNPSKWLSRL